MVGDEDVGAPRVEVSRSPRTLHLARRSAAASCARRRARTGRASARRRATRRRRDRRRADDEQQHRRRRRATTSTRAVRRASRAPSVLDSARVDTTRFALDLQSLSEDFQDASSVPSPPLRPARRRARRLLPSSSLARDAAARRRRPRPASATPARRARRSAPRRPRRATLLGFTPGDDRKVADWTQITDYFDAARPRQRPRPGQARIGTTTLGRPLVVAFISAPENIRESRRSTKKSSAASPTRASSRPRPSATASSRDGKTVVVISCSIHSTEIVASQMSMQLAYELAAADDAETREILRQHDSPAHPLGQPRRHRHRRRLVQDARRQALEGHGAARALSSLRGPRQQPRLVHAQPARDARRHASLLEGVVPADRLRRAPAGRDRLALLRPALLRPAEPAHRAAPAARGRARRPQDRRRPCRPQGFRASSPTRCTTRGGTAAFAPRPTTTTRSASSPKRRARA